MENPLTDEQINELNEIIKLSREEQAKKLPEFLKTLNKEQIEFLKQHQTQQCLFCGIVLNKIPSYKIYEDDNSVVVLDINPASKGHLLVIPKAHIKYSYELDAKIFTLANLFSKRIKDILNADSNILIDNGEKAGQKINHVIINIIPRYSNDNLDFSWQLNKANENELRNLANKLKIEIKEEQEETKPKKKIIYKEIERLP